MTHETLRMAREKKGWSLEELSRRAGIRLKAAQHIEQGEFGELPAGLYCRSTIRSYASAVGLNPQQVLESLGPMLPSGEDPLDGLARRYGHKRKAESEAPEPAASARPAVETDTAYPAPVDLADIVFRVDPTPMSSPIGAASAETEMSAPRPATRFGVDHLKPWWRPLMASVIDGLLLAAMGSLLVWLTAIACGTSLTNALRTGAPGIALVFALIVALYFVLFGGVGTATPGMSAMHLEERTQGRTVLHARDVFGRACRSIFRDSSVWAD